MHALAFRVLRAQSVSEPQARAIAETITAAERDDCKSHGLFRLPGYVSSVRSGKVTADAVPQVRELAPAVVQVDGQNGFAPLALQIGSVPLVEKARRHGIAALAVTRYTILRPYGQKSKHWQRKAWWRLPSPPP